MKNNYQNYLNSDEWKRLRQKACERAGYKCEYCGKDYEAVHHVKYPKNLKDDVLENLIVVCKECHDKSHGIRKEEKQYKRVYLIGKIERNDWRHEIFKELDYASHNNFNVAIYDSFSGLFKYQGPYFENMGGHGLCHGEGNHGSGILFGLNDSDENYCKKLYSKREHTFSECLFDIYSADVCFAFIERGSCYGSLVEIGYAHALKKPICIFHAHEETYNDMWFVNQTRTIKTSFSVNKNPLICWKEFVSAFK